MAEGPQTGPAAPASKASGDVGRRVAARREQLHLSYEELGLRTGYAPEYIEYVETGPATPGIGFLLSLADALETTVEDLTGNQAELPPGIGQAAYHPELVELGPQECWELLASHGVGRVSVSTDTGPAILPVNYLALGGEVSFRTSPQAAPARASGQVVAFEVYPLRLERPGGG
ncbi:pyridoxamine 5'-phosphate oxidase family protein [Streptomyces sp. ISL-43]|uniref:helix-turn-helix domain-containing protein n=1 Tax=Streptomyces sp. ISL-43 TaxID=2819183 RepID=UPI0027E4A0EA|nr:pyridoxamine 5'-phosphate oxidase family protein [Streptomyces sp. ISL-43]